MNMLKVEIKQSFLFAPDTVFDAFTTPSAFSQFLFRTDGGTLVRSELDPELGGAIVVFEKRGEMIAEHYGTFVEIEKPQKISFVFSTVKDSTDSSYVELFFTKTANGTQIHLAQDLPPELADQKDKIVSGWMGIFKKLETFLQSTETNTQKAAVTKDSQGQVLSEGDSVKTIKDLKVKGSSMVVKRGTVVKNIHLIPDNSDEIDCKVDGVGLHLETQWLLKM